MERIQSRFVGVELYFENLERAKKFYIETMGLEVSDEQVGHHAKFDSGAGFVCLERKGAESYPSQDKAVLFFEVADLTQAIAAIGRQHVVQFENTWAVLHDPEGHNILLLQRSN
jgi:predicted enzyme related to lactoylglutathione lyase